MKMKGRRPLLHRLSLLLSQIYQREKPGRRVIVGGVWARSREKQQQRGRCVVAPQLLGVYLCVCVCVCVWMDPVLSFQEKGGAIRGLDRKL